MQFRSFNAPDSNAPDRPLVTVFCAVWHKQPNKLELLRSHWENLKAQSIPVEPCYIFDNGDVAPDWLEAPWHSFDAPLTIYEAWSAATALAQTNYIMNLNMDDRLATNAVQAMVATAAATKSALVGGEWLVSFDESHLEQDFVVEDLWKTNFIADWPPKAQADLRLGSGTGERGTYGPATLWNLKQVGQWYPSYFGNQMPIKSIGDSIFWQMLANKKCKITRIPMIVGRYYSDEDSQAEFRPHQDNDHLRAHGVSLVSFANFILSNDFSKWPGANPEPIVPDGGPRNKVEQASDKLAVQFRAMGLGAQRTAQSVVVP
ncbi:glycosyltransferase family 2 protein [Phaeobacter sp. LSS9]|uniref:glycosyltransferase family 2 protein n=1 Tax=Phaeobacter sp. LSS9 TaxID=681157 RepID=UPI000E50E54A|nr:glycosyltransferase family 2 protein [Phaeobacter sp. LSS9]AXT35991.1 glycosyltransferase family 2 protein [Phaeobacter sp. LSS9]